MSGRSTRSNTDETATLFMLDDENRPIPQMSEEQKVKQFIDQVDAEITQKHKITNRQSTEEQKDTQKKISDLYRSQLEKEYKKLLGSEAKNSELESQISQLEEQISEYSKEGTPQEKTDKIVELEVKNSKLESQVSDLKNRISEQSTKSLEGQTEPFTDEFLTSLDISLTENLNISSFSTANDQITAYKGIVTALQEQVSKHLESIRLQNLSLTALKATVENFNKQGSVSAQNLDLPASRTENNSAAANKMNVEAKDAILAIPVFSGDQKELDTFINTCDLYNSLVLEANRATLLLIIKAKIRGEALLKITPFEDCNTWAELKKRIRDRIRKPVTLEFAQEDLNKVAQAPNESMEDYGKKVKDKLRKLNEASRQLGTTDVERAILQKANERLAISKFEQNIKDNTVRVLVSATKNESLDDAIQMALQKELMEKNKNVSAMKCTHCGMTNHNIDTCRKKQNSNENKNKNNNNRSFSRNYPKNDQKNDSKQSSNDTQSKNSNQSQNQGQSFNRNQNRNGNQRAVRSMEEELDSITLQEALEKEESDGTKNE